MRTRHLLAAPAAAALLLAGLGGVAAAQDTGDEIPEACTGMAADADTKTKSALALNNVVEGVTQAEVDRLQSIIDGDAEGDPTAAGRKLPIVQAAVEAKAALSICIEDNTDAGAGDESGDTDTDTGGTDNGTGDVADEDPPYETCAEAIAAGEIIPAIRGLNDSYQADLDADGDGVACEANEGTGTPPTDNGSGGNTGGGTGDFSQLDDVPSAAAETGGGPA